MDNKQAQYIKMTETPIPKLIVSLSIPTILSLLVTNIYNLVDTAFVGTLGTSASGAIGIVFGFMAILQAFGFMFGMGSGVLMSRLLGKKDDKTASAFASTGFFSALAFGILIGIIGFVFLDKLVILLGSTKTIKPYAKNYVRFILIAAPVIVPTFVMNNLLRYEGKANLGMVGLLTGAILNIGGDALFIFIFKMGISGAGLSTCISQYISFGIMLFMFISKKTTTSLSLRSVSKAPKDYLNILTTGFPSLLRQGLNSITTMVLNYEAKPYGDYAVAGMSIVTRISFSMFALALGVGQGFQPVCTFNYGAKKIDRLKKAYKFSLILSECIMVVTCISVYFFREQIVSLFRDDSDVIMVAARSLKFQCFSLLFLAPCMVTEMTCQGTGHKINAAFLSSLRSGILFIPSLLILSYFRGLHGIEEAQSVANILSVIPVVFITIWLFRRLNSKN